MKWHFVSPLFAMVFLFTISCSLVLAAEQASPFNEANAKYRTGEFREAEALYEELGKTHPTAALYYNLGNASFRDGHKGKSLVYYRRAQRISPRDRDLLWNIGVLKGALVDRFERQDKNFVLRALEETADLATMDELGWVFTAGTAALAGVCLLGFLFQPLRFVIRPLAFLLILYLCCAALLLCFKWAEEKDPHAVMLDKETFALYGPSEKESRAFALHEGTEGRVLDRSRDWVYLGTPDGKSGWVPETSCEIV